VLEKVLCHDGTTGLAIQINDSDWWYVPEASHIPAPQASYQYQTYYHRVTLTDVSMFQSGRNVLSTGKTPKINGKTVHGMEVNWPGIMVLIRYQK
jgi:hypothetical protein